MGGTQRTQSASRLFVVSQEGSRTDDIGVRWRYLALKSYHPLSNWAIWTSLSIIRAPWGGTPQADRLFSIQSVQCLRATFCSFPSERYGYSPATNGVMGRLIPGLDSAHRKGSETTLQGILMVVENGGKGGRINTGGIFHPQKLG